MRYAALLSTTLALTALLTAANAQTPKNGDLPRFLPNHGNSVYSVPGMLREWPSGGPKELWRANVGWGKSAVVEVDGRAFTAVETEDKQWAVCLDPTTGKTLWKHLIWPEKNRHFTKGPVTSPLVDGDRVYFIPYAIKTDVWDMGSPIICLNVDDGTELWRVEGPLFGTEASTPLIVGDTLYVSTDNPERVVLAALNKHTGEQLWSVAMEEVGNGREMGAPSSLTYQVVDGVPQVIVATYGTTEVLGVHATTGEIMWRYLYTAPIKIGLVSTPVAIGSRLFVCGGEGKGKNFSACLQMEAVDGKIGFEEIYTSDELQTNAYNTVAVYDDAVFGFGGNEAAGFLHCTNFADGALLWKEASRQWTSQQNLIVVNDLLLAITKAGDLVLAEASREGYHELSRMTLPVDLGRPQQPTIANGRMYIRGMETVVCYEIAK